MVSIFTSQLSTNLSRKACELISSAGFLPAEPIPLAGCGMELYRQGDSTTAKTLGEKIINLCFDSEYVVFVSTSNVAYVQKQFGHLFHNTTLHNQYRSFVSKCYDLTDFIVNVAHYTPNVPFPHCVAIMDCCAALRDYNSPACPQNLKQTTRQLLSSIPDITLVEMPNNDTCCGFGGLFANFFTPISDDLARKKVEAALTEGAEYITSTDYGCLIHLQSYIDHHKLPLRCIHPLEIIAPQP